MIDPCDSILLHELNHAIHLLLLLIYLLIYPLSYHPLRPLLLLPENHDAPVQVSLPAPFSATQMPQLTLLAPCSYKKITTS